MQLGSFTAVSQTSNLMLHHTASWHWEDAGCFISESRRHLALRPRYRLRLRSRSVRWLRGCCRYTCINMMPCQRWHRKMCRCTDCSDEHTCVVLNQVDVYDAMTNRAVIHQMPGPISDRCANCLAFPPASGLLNPVFAHVFMQ